MKDVGRLAIRMSPSLSAWIRDQARQNLRSMNAEIVHRLERTRWQDDPASIPASARTDAAAAT